VESGKVLKYLGKWIVQPRAQRPASLASVKVFRFQVCGLSGRDSFLAPPIQYVPPTRGHFSMSHDDVNVMCHSNIHDLFVTWQVSVASDIIFR
jgi:hypothetical protein